jgi:hypothetical protein
VPVTDEPKRITLSAQEVAVMREVLGGAPPDVLDAADRIARGQVVPDEDAEAVVDALVAVMLADTGYDAEQGLTVRGNTIDDVIGVVQQMSEQFYD